MITHLTALLIGIAIVFGTFLVAVGAAWFIDEWEAITPFWVVLLLLALGGLLLLRMLAPEPTTDTLPTSPGQVSPECTEDDLADGSCYTYQDFHDSEWRTD